MSESGDSTSKSSGTSGGGSINSNNSDAKALDDLHENGGEDIGDLLDQNKSLQDTVFATLYTLTKNKNAASWRITAIKVVLLFLQLFRVVFNSSMGWDINNKFWLFSSWSWILYRIRVVEQGYNFYITIFYIVASATILCVFVTVWVALLIRKDDNSGVWMRRLVAILQWLAFLLFQMFWVVNLDFLVYIFDCEWSKISTHQVYHMGFKEQNCLAMPHLLHMGFGLFAVLIFGLATSLMSIADSNLNPMCTDLLGSPTAMVNFKILALKIIMIIAATDLDEIRRVQVVIVFVCMVLNCYYMLTSSPYYNELVNHLWAGLWSGVCFTSAMLVALAYGGREGDLAADHKVTTSVVYGIFPAVLVGALFSWLILKWKKRVLPVLRQAHSNRLPSTDLRAVFRFSSPGQVELLVREMRRWDLDGVPDPQAADFGEFILKCGMARFPQNAMMLIMLGNWTIEVRKDGQSARNVLQTAAQCNPSLVERYFIYSCNEMLKRLKTDSEGMDLMGYVEFQRNYRACVRAHKLALTAQRHFWFAMLRDTVAFDDVQKAVDTMDAAEKRATQVYKRVMELYPRNGKLLKVYGRYLEYVRNDPWTAGKYYAEALKLGTSESLLSLMVGGEVDSLGNGLEQVDEKVDAIIIINAAGVIMMANAAAATMFSFEKGELEGKNVSCLMPQPFSSRHNSYLQRYLTTGEPHILGQRRNFVALDKNHNLFPVELLTIKLSGTGQDTVFMGVVHKPENRDTTAIKVWMTTAGIVLCADELFNDAFGMEPATLVGRPFSSMGTDMEAIQRFINKVCEAPHDQVAWKPAVLRTKLLHAFLPAMEVDLVPEIGGSADNALICMNIKCLTDTTNLMVVTHKGAICFASNQLATMLGYPLKTFIKLPLKALMPQPYSLLHDGWMKDLSHRVPPSSCRSGAVVHLLRANGTKLPVTLQLSTHDNGNHVKHIVQVTKATESEQVDKQRLLLSINQHGEVLSINCHTSDALFGFAPECLIGRPLAAFINIFSQWRAAHQGEDRSLLLLLGHAVKEGNCGQTAWRVGVRAPVADGEILDVNEVGTLGGEDEGHLVMAGGSLLSLMRQKGKLRPAIMELTMVKDNCDGSSELAEDNIPVLQVALWSAEAATGVVEVDHKLTISRIDEVSSLLFGMEGRRLVKQPFTSLVTVPESTIKAELLGSDKAKKGLLKASAGTSVAAKTGPRKTYTVKHIDGQQLNLQLQAVCKDTSKGSTWLIHLHVMDPSVGSIEPFQALANGRASNEDLLPAAATDTKTANSFSAEKHSRDNSSPKKDDCKEQRKQISQENGSEESIGDSTRQPMSHQGHGHHGIARYDRHQGRNTRAVDDDFEEGRSGSPDLHGRLNSRLRTQQWLQNSFQDHEPDDEYQDTPHVVVHAPGRSPAGPSKDTLKPGKHGDERCTGADSDSSDGQGSAAGRSVMSGSQISGDEASSVVTSSAGGGDEELTADYRRAKRLKKLVQMFTSSAAQIATNRFSWQTWILVGVVLITHALCFAVLTTQVTGRAANAFYVGTMAKATDRFQRTTLRANYIYRCSLPEFASFEVCSAHDIAAGRNSAAKNIDSAQYYHQTLFLGNTKLETFKDPRLLDHWLHYPLPEHVFVRNAGSQEDVVLEGTRSLWELGNRVNAYAKDVFFLFPSLGAAINETEAWQYVYRNGADGVFKGYAWSLDVFVDYCWSELTSLSLILIALLVVESVLVQPICMAYEFFLLKLLQREHLKRFSIFLALPSATIRVMATRQLQVDDDDKSDADDDELEGMPLAVEAETSQKKEGQEEDKKKSVRMASELGQADDDEERAHKKAAMKKSGVGTGQQPHKKAREPKTGCQLFWKSANITLFGWLQSKLKLNGKKLLGGNRFITSFMIPLVLWVMAVIVVFGVSFQRLKGLQGPLASLNSMAHVTYRASRVRMYANLLAMSVLSSENAAYRASLNEELAMLYEEYSTLLYGGKLRVMAEGLTFDATAPASAFQNAQLAEVFFKTKSCLRADQSSCYTEDKPYYLITHSGLDAMMNRYIDEAHIFAGLPDSLAWGNHSAFIYIERVGAKDMFDGLDQASNLFDEYTLQQFNTVKQLHIILLVVTIALIAAFILFKYRPYVQRVKGESKMIAGLLSQLPAEVDVLPQVKQVVLGIRKEDATGSVAAAQIAVMPGMLIPPAAGFPGSMIMSQAGAPGSMMLSQAGAPGMVYHHGMYGSMNGAKWV